MKKYGILIAISLAAGLAFGVTTVTISVPDQHATQVLAAMNELAGTQMTLEAQGSAPDPADEFDGRWNFRISPKDPNETNKQFATRFSRELVRASVRLVKSAEEHKRYRDDINAVNPPDVNVPDDIIE